jgi:hypothetical protein
MSGRSVPAPVHDRHTQQLREITAAEVSIFGQQQAIGDGPLVLGPRAPIRLLSAVSVGPGIRGYPKLAATADNGLH